MKLLASIRPEDVDSESPQFDYATFKPRPAGRAVIFDDDKVCLIHVGTHDYYMLPGGGIEDEDMPSALAREIMEEVGCEVTIDQEVGSVELYFDRWQQKQQELKLVVRSSGTYLLNILVAMTRNIRKLFFEGWLNCYENEVEYKDRNISIPANQIASFEITGKEQTNTRLSVTRMVTLGVFSLAAPKRSTKKEATIYVGLKDGRQLMFQTTNLTESDAHRKLASAISHYSSLQTKQNGHQQSAPTQTLDVAGEIARFADLKKQGILTDDEFEAKKKQLLNL